MQVMRCFNAIFEMAARIVVDVVPVRPEDEVQSLRAGACPGSGLTCLGKLRLTGSQRLKSGSFGFPAGGFRPGPTPFAIWIKIWIIFASSCFTPLVHTCRFEA